MPYRRRQSRSRSDWSAEQHEVRSVFQCCHGRWEGLRREWGNAGRALVAVDVEEGDLVANEDHDLVKLPIIQQQREKPEASTVAVYPEVAIVRGDLTDRQSVGKGNERCVGEVGR